MSSVLWHCWLGGRKSIRPVKTRVMRCWRGYLFGVRCKMTCIWSSWCHCHPIICASVKSRIRGIGRPLDWFTTTTTTTTVLQPFVQDYPDESVPEGFADMMGWQWHQLNHMQAICLGKKLECYSKINCRSDGLSVTKLTATKHCIRFWVEQKYWYVFSLKWQWIKFIGLPWRPKWQAVHQLHLLRTFRTSTLSPNED